MKTLNCFFRTASVVCLVIFASISFAHNNDTLKCHFASPNTPVLYHASTGGYVCGNNGYGYMEVAQKYAQAPSGDTIGSECACPDQHGIHEVKVRFGAKRVAHANDTVYIKVYDLNSATHGPGNVIGTTLALGLNFIDTTSGNYTSFIMNLPLGFTDSFFVSVVLPQQAGDTVGVISNTDGEGLGEQLSWVKGSNGWSSVLSARALDIDACILPVVGDIDEGGVHEESLPMHVNVFPNPARNNAVIEYSLARPVQQLNFKLVDISGKIVYCLPLSRNAVGEHKLNINTSEMAAGSYFYSFESDGQKYNGKLDVIK